MKRNITHKLIEWKERAARKPLVVQGVRQCGKTYSIREFGREHFRRTCYFNFERTPVLADIFSYDLDTGRILRELAIAAGLPTIDTAGTLIFFDEIQACPQAVTALKYFCEERPEMYIIAAGSLLGVALAHQNISFPVGKVEFLTMYPMAIDEFLVAAGYRRELAMLREYAPDRALPEGMIGELSRACTAYMAIGGMPEAVAKWTETHSFADVDEVLRAILQGYASDFGKYLPASEAVKVGSVWDSVPVQLAKENNKFVFSHVRQGKRSTELEDALEWLRRAGLVNVLRMIGNPELPLSFYADATYFKVYVCDVGLLRVMMGLDAQSVLTPGPLVDTFRGPLTENYVMNGLVSMGYVPYFWRSGNTAEVDFIIESASRVVPIEVKAGGNTRAKSYGIFCTRYRPPLGFKLSMNNVGSNTVADTLTYSLPLCLLWHLPAYLY